MSTSILSDITITSRMLGWHHTGEDCQEALSAGKMLHFLAETTNRCDFDCEYCYTVEVTIENPEGRLFHTRPLPGELALSERLALIDMAADLGAKTYDIVGAGEPLIDPHCLRQIEYAADRGLQVVVFTNGSTLGDAKRGPEMAKRLWELGVTVVIKHHGNAETHDRIVRRQGAAARRDQALSTLIELGFNACTPTRLGIDNIVYAATLNQMPECLRWCRKNNIHLVCSTFIPTGRTQKADERSATWEELEALYRECKRIDEEEFGIVHSGRMPFLGQGRTCTQYLGLYVTIKGDVYGCVGKMETYGNIREQKLSDMWSKRLPHLKQSFDGGCPPRQIFYQEFGIKEENLRKLF